MPPKRTKAPAKRQSKRREVCGLSDRLVDDTDRYGETFLSNYQEFDCVEPGCGLPGDWCEIIDCGHTYNACETHRRHLPRLKIGQQQCIFCYRRMMDKIRRQLNIATIHPLADDFYGDRAVREYLAVIP